jgi:endonuclease YncB( thermonuclease family)
MKTLFDTSRRNRTLDIILFAIIVLGILTVLRFLPKPEPVELSGTARIIDGDSIVVRGVEIRLLGVDAPEYAQNCMRGGSNWPCGADSARKLGNLLRGHTVSCKGGERDVHDRLLAVCRVRGDEINHWLVEQGWALSYHAYPGAERSAKAAKRGIWSGTFIRPRAWREENR